MNPVLVNDLRRSLFRRKPVLAVALMALAILVLTFGVLGVFPIGFARQLRYTPLWRFPDLLLPLVAPAFAAGAFAKEHEQRTWQDVLLTRLSAAQILWGKFWACFLPTVVTIVVLFPPFLLLLILQNVPWALNSGPWMFLVGGKFLVSVTFYIAVVLVCSFYSKNARTALVVAYVMLGLYALFNYLLWTYFLNPLFWPVNMDYISRYGGYYGGYGYNYGNPWSASLDNFSFTPAEWLHIVQSVLFSLFLLIYLGRRVRRRQ